MKSSKDILNRGGNSQENRGFSERLRNTKLRHAWKWASLCFGVFVAVLMFHSLKKPAITMENQICQLEEHGHSEECYAYDHEEATPETLTALFLNCEFQPHVHSEACEDEEGNIVCGYTESFIHVHDESCYEADMSGEHRLVCQLNGLPEHEHTDECYVRQLVCGKTENEGHIHSDACYSTVYYLDEEPICGLQETDSHIHTDDCYALVLNCDLEHEHTDECYLSELICGMEEGQTHTHTRDCYPSMRELICELEETEGHTHDESCYAVLLDCPYEHVHTPDCFDDQGHALCGYTETLRHQHTEDCFTPGTIVIRAGHVHTDACEKVLVCGLEAHVHTDACFTSGNGLDEEMTVEEESGIGYKEDQIDTDQLLLSETEQTVGEDEQCLIPELDQDGQQGVVTVDNGSEYTEEILIQEIDNEDGLESEIPGFENQNSDSDVLTEENWLLNAEQNTSILTGEAVEGVVATETESGLETDESDNDSGTGKDDLPEQLTEETGNQELDDEELLILTDQSTNAKQAEILWEVPGEERTFFAVLGLDDWFDVSQVLAAAKMTGQSAVALETDSVSLQVVDQTVRCEFAFRTSRVRIRLEDGQELYVLCAYSDGANAGQIWEELGYNGASDVLISEDMDVEETSEILDGTEDLDPETEEVLNVVNESEQEFLLEEESNTETLIAESEAVEDLTSWDEILIEAEESSNLTEEEDGISQQVNIEEETIATSSDLSDEPFSTPVAEEDLLWDISDDTEKPESGELSDSGTDEIQSVPNVQESLATASDLSELLESDSSFDSVGNPDVIQKEETLLEIFSDGNEIIVSDAADSVEENAELVATSTDLLENGDDAGFVSLSESTDSVSRDEWGDSTEDADEEDRKTDPVATDTDLAGDNADSRNDEDVATATDLSEMEDNDANEIVQEENVISDEELIEEEIQDDEELVEETQALDLIYYGEDYTVAIYAGDEAGIPDGSILVVTELTDEEVVREYEANILETTRYEEKQVGMLRLFDIQILDENGSKVEPLSRVSVVMTMESMVNTEFHVVHFKQNDSDESEALRSAETKTMKKTTLRSSSSVMAVPAVTEQIQVLETIVTEFDEKTCDLSFETDSFSVYAVFGTTIEKNVLASDGNNYKISVTFGPEAGIPDGAELEVSEILPVDEVGSDISSTYGKSYEEYVTYTENALGLEEGSAEYIRLFDISIVRDGEKLQPVSGSSVSVRVELADSDSDELSVVHFTDGANEGEKLESSTMNDEDGAVVEFNADSFSVYSIVDAPEPASYMPAGWHAAESLDQIEELGEDGFYVSWNRYYLTGGLVQRVSGNNDRNGLEATLTQYDSVPEDVAAKFYFIRQEGTDTFKIYVEGEGGTRKYVEMTSVNGNNNRAGLTFVSEESAGTAFTVEKNGNSNSFYISAKLPNGNEYWWNRNTNSDGGVGAFAAYSGKNNNNTAKVILSYYIEPEPDWYKLDGQTFGIAYHNDSVTAAALMAENKTSGNQSRLTGLDMLMREDVLTNDGILLVAEDSDIQEWTFESIEEDKYYIKTIVDGATKYLLINGSSISLVDDREYASSIKATPGTGSNSGKWHFTVGNYSLNFTGSAANGFNAANNSNATTWLNLVEKSTITENDFVNYSARKISASDDILSATEKDENGQILYDGNGNVVYRENKTQVVIYTRVWNETTKKYEFYAVDHDGSLVRIYDSGDKINWIGNQVNSALWEFTEYTNEDGTPNYYYELENTAYTGTYLAPQSDGIIAHQPVGINLNGRRDGFDYSSIIAWDDPAYAYSGLKIERDENGALRVVACSLDEAADFHFAVITPPVEEADPTTTVATVDNEEFGISIKMIDFNNAIVGDRDSVQTAYLGTRPWDSAHAYEAETGLVSTNLTGGYPTITAHTEKEGSSLSGLFNNMTSANHLFIQSVYNESGYFEYDSTQNFAHLNDNGNFTVYNQLGAIGTSTTNTRVHGQFMPYNDISSETGYAHDTQGNVITNQRNIRGEELSDTDPRKGEPLYLIPQNEADYYFGMELSAVFTQTPDGVDNWGHDIIFEFTGDDDFWFYVDGELVLDLGGVHSAVGGSVNFRTGEVVCNGTTTSLYEVFKSNYQARGLDPSSVDNLFVTKIVNGETVHVFNDYTTHEMKMFYMERGGGASNLKMRFNLASVKPGTVELSKKLKGIDNASNKLIQYPYQIWYQTAEYAQNEDGTYVLDGNGQRVIASYNPAVLLSQPETNANLTGQVYAVYKGTKTLIPYKDSMEIGGVTYNNVFLLKAGETAVINFPENTYRYKLVECGVDTAVYDHVYINGDQNEIFGKPYNNTDGWDPDGGPETLPDSTTTYEGTTRSDFGITYYTTEGRPRVEYTNEVPPEVMRTVSFEKVLYDTNGQRLTDEEAAQITSAFTFRLYLGNEFADQENLLPADMYTYYIKGPDQNYCKWDKASGKFISLGVGTFEEFRSLSEAEQRAGTFTTSMYGSISKIPAGYTIEVRDLIVGTKYKIDEPDRELPKGYTRRDSDGYVRTDLAGGEVVYYTDDGTYGQHPEAGNTITAEPISDTIVDKTESPMIEIRNQEGWGLTAKKEWTDKDFMIHNPVYLAVYLDDGNGNPGTLVDGSVRRLKNNESEVYWFFQDLKINGEPHLFNEFIVREVELTGTPSVDESTGAVTGYTAIAPIAEGGSISVGCRTVSGTERTENYTVHYQPGESTGQNENIRNDTVTNSRPGIQIYKTDWNGENFLSGAGFTLKDSDGHDVGAASYISDNKGLVTTAYLNEGTFTLDEIKTPAGYVALDEPISITVTTTQPSSYDLTVAVGTTTYYISLNGPTGFFIPTPATESSMARITVKNRTVRELKVVKEGVDGSTRTPLTDVHFALYEQVKDSEGNLRPAYNPLNGYDDLATNAEGILSEITMSIGAGTYYLREKAVPSGYKKLAEDLCFTIGEDGKVTIHNAGYSGWLTRNTSVPGTVSYQISIENTPVGITIRKTDETGRPLPGSQFVLCRKNDYDVFVNVSEYGLGENGLIDLTDGTEITISGMANGIYKLTETCAPSGYIIMTKDIYFTVSEGGVTLTNMDGEAETYSDVSLLDDNTTIAVKNTAGAQLPSTGGSGTGFFTILGSILIAGAAGLLLWRRRKMF